MGVLTESRRWKTTRKMNRRKKAREDPVRMERHVTHVLAGEPGSVPPLHDFDGDLGARVARAHDERAALSKLGWASIIERVHLDDVGPEVLRERRHPGALVARHRHDDVIGLELHVAGGHHVAGPASRYPFDGDAGAHGQLEPRRVRLEVVGHLVLRGERVARPRKGHAGEPVEARRAEKTKRIPATAPRVADARRCVEDDEAKVPPGEVVARREPGLAAADDDDVEPLPGRRPRAADERAERLALFDEARLDRGRGGDP